MHLGKMLIGPVRRRDWSEHSCKKLLAEPIADVIQSTSGAADEHHLSVFPASQALG